jgi:hypothetical protein
VKRWQLLGKRGNVIRETERQLRQALHEYFKAGGTESHLVLRMRERIASETATDLIDRLQRAPLSK